MRAGSGHRRPVASAPNASPRRDSTISRASIAGAASGPLGRPPSLPSAAASPRSPVAPQVDEVVRIRGSHVDPRGAHLTADRVAAGLRSRVTPPNRSQDRRHGLRPSSWRVAATRPSRIATGILLACAIPSPRCFCTWRDGRESTSLGSSWLPGGARSAGCPRSKDPVPSQYAACAAFRQPVRRYSPDRCCRTVVSLMPSSWAAAATDPARTYTRRTSSCRRVGRCFAISRPSAGGAANAAPPASGSRARRVVAGVPESSWRYPSRPDHPYLWQPQPSPRE